MLRFFRHYIPMTTIAFCVVELCFLYWSFYIYHARAAGSAGGNSIYVSGAFALSVFVMMFSLGLYSRTIFLRPREMLIRTLISFCLVIPVFIGGSVVASNYLPRLVPYSYESFAPGILFGLLAIAGTRFLILPMINVRALKRRILVIGAGEFARRIEQLIAANANHRVLLVDY